MYAQLRMLENTFVVRLTHKVEECSRDILRLQLSLRHVATLGVGEGM